MEPSAADTYGRVLLAGPVIFPDRLLDARGPLRGEAPPEEVREAFGLQRRLRQPGGER